MTEAMKKDRAKTTIYNIYRAWNSSDDEEE